jgi:hypothetical protein
MYGTPSEHDGRRVSMYRRAEDGLRVASITMRDGRVYRIVGRGRAVVSKQVDLVLAWDAASYRS